MYGSYTGNSNDNNTSTIPIWSCLAVEYCKSTSVPSVLTKGGCTLLAGSGHPHWNDKPGNPEQDLWRNCPQPICHPPMPSAMPWVTDRYQSRNWTSSALEILVPSIEAFRRACFSGVEAELVTQLVLVLWAPLHRPAWMKGALYHHVFPLLVSFKRLLRCTIILSWYKDFRPGVHFEANKLLTWIT